MEAGPTQQILHRGSMETEGEVKRFKGVDTTLEVWIRRKGLLNRHVSGSLALAKDQDGRKREDGRGDHGGGGGQKMGRGRAHGPKRPGMDPP